MAAAAKNLPKIEQTSTSMQDIFHKLSFNLLLGSSEFYVFLWSNRPPIQNVRIDLLSTFDRYSLFFKNIHSTHIKTIHCSSELYFNGFQIFSIYVILLNWRIINFSVRLYNTNRKFIHYIPAFCLLGILMGIFSPACLSLWLITFESLYTSRQTKYL